MLIAYLSFSFLLNNASDPVFAKIQSIRVSSALPEPKALPPAESRLTEFLAPEIREGLVAVRDEDGRSIIILRGDGLFAPGSATISDKFLPVLGRVSDALNSVTGQVKITGHTDDQPIRSVRFPSNWHLSKERANSVMQILAAKGVLPGRLSAEGHADAEPVALNDTPAEPRTQSPCRDHFVYPAGTWLRRFRDSQRTSGAACAAHSAMMAISPAMPQ